MKLKMKSDFDTIHKVHMLPVISTTDTVWLPNENTETLVIEKVGPREHTVATFKGTLQRNRSQIRAMPQMELTEDNFDTSSSDKNVKEDSSKSSPNEDANPNKETKTNLDSPPVTTTSNEKETTSGPPDRGVGSKFVLVRQILCQSSQHSMQMQSTLHARGVWGHAPTGNS